jgi:hypothetical protein
VTPRTDVSLPNATPRRLEKRARMMMPLEVASMPVSAARFIEVMSGGHMPTVLVVDDNADTRVVVRRDLAA